MEVSFLDQLKSAKKAPKGFWKICLSDMVAFVAILAINILTWIYVGLNGSVNSIVYYWDGPNYMYAAATLYDIPRNNPWTLGFKYPPSYFACHLPGYPLVIRFSALLTFGNYFLASYIAILITSILFVYAFRRLLIIYNCVENPLFSTIISIFVPIRFFIYHSVGASEPLFLSFVCFSFIFYKTNSFFFLILSVWGGCITRIEGMAIGATIGFCYLLSFNIVRALSMFLTFVAPLFLVIFHQFRFNDAMAYIHFNKDQQNLIVWKPLHELSEAHSDKLYSYSSIVSFFFCALGVIVLFEKCLPVAIFCSIYLVYISLLFHIDVFRYSIPVSVFSFIIGFDVIWNQKYTKLVFLSVSPLFLIIALAYASGQIHSNRAPDSFMDHVFKSIRSL